MTSLTRLLLLAALSSWGCGGSGGGSGDSGDGGAGTGSGSGGGDSSSSDVTGVVWTEGGYLGWPLESDTPEPILAEGLFEGGDAFAADDSGVWIGFSEGEMYGFEADGTQVAGPIDVGADGIGPGQMALGDGEVWLLRSLTETGPAVYDIASGTLTETGALPEGYAADYGGIVIDGEDVFVLLSNGFAILRFDVGTREMTAAAVLGEDPADPSGPRGEFYGYGALGVDEDAVWVVDAYSRKLLQIDRSDLTVEETIDLAGEIPEDSDNVAIGLQVGDENVYVVNHDDGADGSDILAIDKASLDVSVVLATDEEILAGVAANKDLLLYELVGDGVRIIDGTTGDHVASYPLLSLDDRPTIWVP